MHETLREITDLLDRGAWLAASALLIGLLAWAAKSPRFFGGPLARIPRERRVYVVAGLGVLSGVLEAVVRGVPWPRAIAQGVLSAGLAVLGHNMGGGISPAGAPPQAQGDIPVPAAGLVVDTTLADVPSAPDTVVAAPPVTPETSGVVPAQPVVEASLAWGPEPRPSER